MFFVTYAAAQVPSNMALVREGGPLWLGFIMFGWGVVATAFVGAYKAHQGRAHLPLARATSCMGSRGRLRYL